MNCEGSCEEHYGDVVYVSVKSTDVRSPVFDWGNFWYCECAIKEDIERGFIVIEANSA